MSNDLQIAIRLLTEELDARIDALLVEIAGRQQAVDELQALRAKFQTLPLWTDPKRDAIEQSLVIRDDEFGHLTMAQAAEEVLSRAAGPLHAKEIWFALRRGGYAHASPTSFQALVTGMNRLKSRFCRVAPNVFALVTAVSREQSPVTTAEGVST